MVNNYVDPGTYVSELIIPRAAIAPGVGFNVVVVGEGSKTKVIANEPIVRGKIYGETLTVAGAPPHTATLLNVADQNVSNATLYKNGAALPLGAWFFSGVSTITIQDLYYTAGAVYTFDYVSTNSYMDTLKNTPIDILSTGLFVNSSSYKQNRDFIISGNNVEWKVPGSEVPVQAVVTGSRAETFNTTGGHNLFNLSINWLPEIVITLTAGTARTAAQVVDEINAALNADPNYGASYAASASVASIGGLNYVRITAPDVGGHSGANSQVVLYRAGGSLALSRIFGLAEADSPWEFEGIDAGSMVLPLQAVFISLNHDPYNIPAAPNNQLGISLNGLPMIVVNLTVGAAETAAQMVNDINAALNADPNYGALYSTVASVAVVGGNNYVKLTAPVIEPYLGDNSSIVLYALGTSDILDTIFGLDPAGSPWQYRGTGRKPLFGQTYYMTYTITRPLADYNTLREFDTNADFFGDIGYQDIGIPLTLAGGIAWSEPIAKLYVVQVLDGDGDGVYTDDDYILAINTALPGHREATEITCLRSTAAIRAAIFQLMERECALVTSNYKRYWAGVPRNTQPGDASTSDTIIYIAQRELHPDGDDVTRGRFILTAPPNRLYSFVDVNGVSQTALVDSSFASVMLAARVASFAQASMTLFRKQFAEMTNETNYSDGVRRNLSANGVNVMTQVGGAAMVFDALTTDSSGDARFEEPSASVQKDLVTFDIISNINRQLMGIVPDSPADMVADIKTVIGGVLLARIDSGDIGYYTESDGQTVRDIDYSQDIVVYKDAVDARTYRFKFYFNLKYPAKRFYGQLSVDIPFTVGS